jgi:hypothetical protein
VAEQLTVYAVVLEVQPEIVSVAIAFPPEYLNPTVSELVGADVPMYVVTEL